MYCNQENEGWGKCEEQKQPIGSSSSSACCEGSWDIHVVYAWSFFSQTSKWEMITKGVGEKIFSVQVKSNRPIFN